MFEEHMEQQEEPFPEESNDIPIDDDDEEMSELDFEDSDDESSPETTEIRKEDVSNIVIGLKGMHLRYKVHFNLLVVDTVFV